MAELQPCPFCGGEAAFLGTTCTIKCKQCGGAFIATNPVVARMEIAAAWNRRGNEERTLDFPAKYTEIRALYHFCVDLGIKCTIEHLYDGYAVRFPDGSDFAQHHGTYGGTEGCVEPAIGDSEFDYTAVGLNLAKELVKKHKGKLEANHA